MSRQIALKYVLPVAAVALLLLLAAWAFRLPPVSALTGRDAPAAAVSPQPGEQVTGYAYDVVQVSGTGMATGTPDIAKLDLGVSVSSKTVADAKSTADASVKAILTALNDNGVADKDRTTSNFRVYGDYDYTDRGRVLRGYVVDYDLRVTVRSIASTGAVIDAAIAAGGDYVVFDRLAYSFSNKAAMESKARKAAVNDMRIKAQQMAQFSGRQLGKLMVVSESPISEAFGTVREFAAMAADSGSIAVGEEEIRVTVHGVYELR